jgi:hypothetical protein
MKDRQQKEFDAFPMGAAFSNQQFKDMMEKWGLTVNDTDKICSIGGGCYIRKTDKEALCALINRLNNEKENAIAADLTGDGFIFDMFVYELANHEYCITYDLEETLDALGLTPEEVNADELLKHGLNKAIKYYLKNHENL